MNHLTFLGGRGGGGRGGEVEDLIGQCNKFFPQRQAKQRFFSSRKAVDDIELIVHFFFKVFHLFPASNGNN